MDELSKFGAVVTTYQRLSNEQPRWAESPLSRIYWLRMVLVRNVYFPVLPLSIAVHTSKFATWYYSIFQGCVL